VMSWQACRRVRNGLSKYGLQGIRGVLRERPTDDQFPAALV
jgi:hypothetical protein